MGGEVQAVLADNGDVLLVGDAASAPFHDPKLDKVHTYFARAS